MTHKNILCLGKTGSLVGLLAASALLATGCAYETSRGRTVYQEPARVVVVEQDDYVYYPQYEVYYSNRRHQYGYRHGNAWAWRPAPPGISVKVLYSSPSVRMDFHDSPERHHNTVIRNYPRNWKPADKGRGQVDRRNDHRDDERKH